MKEYRNCLNCGAPLNYGKSDYENIARCVYCGTEYHIDRLGKIEEYKVKLMVFGKIKEFYICDLNFHNLCESYRTIVGQLATVESGSKIELRLIEM